MMPNTNKNYQSRLQAIDLLRGVIIMIMALDHTRDYMSPTLFDPIDLSHTSVLLFLTRWITNICAPTFVFLTGISAYLYSLKHTKKELSLFLIKRGIFIMLLDITFISFFWGFDFSSVDCQVMWVIGICMILLAGLNWLPKKILLPLALIIIFGHDYFDIPNPTNSLPMLWSFLHVPQHFVILNRDVFLDYPLIPWPGIMLLGFCVGQWFQDSVALRSKKLMYLGMGCLALYLVIRCLNIYGDIQQWHTQDRGTLFTVLSFITVSKYPPSLLYVLVNIGIATLLWPLWENWQGKSNRIPLTFGKTALFFYLVHIPFIHSLAIVYSRLFLHIPGGWWWANGKVITSFPSSYHFSLLRTYIVWIIVLACLYPLCHYYQVYKSKHNYRWLKYL